MRLQHLALPGLTSYAHASEIQERLVRALLDFKAHRGTTSEPPPPTIITAQFQPVYTCGRRDIAQLSDAEKYYLRRDGRAEFHEALRGGQTTFHGPGQLVAYPIVDLKTHFTSHSGAPTRPLGPRDYVCKLEETVIRTLAHYGINSFRTENAGVWTSDDKKICALGVHMRRHVTSHGIGLNVSTDLEWFRRIVACGLVGKSASSMAELGATIATAAAESGRNDAAVMDVGETFVKCFKQVYFKDSTETVPISEDQLG